MTVIRRVYTKCSGRAGEDYINKISKSDISIYIYVNINILQSRGGLISIFSHLMVHLIQSFPARLWYIVSTLLITVNFTNVLRPYRKDNIGL